MTTPTLVTATKTIEEEIVQKVFTGLLTKFQLDLNSLYDTFQAEVNRRAQQILTELKASESTTTSNAS